MNPAGRHLSPAETAKDLVRVTLAAVKVKTVDEVTVTFTTTVGWKKFLTLSCGKL